MGGSPGIILGDQGLEVEPAVIGKFGKIVSQADGTASNSLLLNYFSEAQRSPGWRLQLGLAARPSPPPEGSSGFTPQSGVLALLVNSPFSSESKTWGPWASW